MREKDTPRPGPLPDPDARIRSDLRALAARSRKDPPSLTQTMRSLSGRRREGAWEERLMAWTGFLKMHPRLLTLAVTAAVAAALLVVPVSYNKVVGQTVSVSFDGGSLGPELVQGLAAEFKEALDADAVTVGAESNDGAATYALTATVPGKRGPSVAQAFARVLDARGIPAEASATPVRRKVSGNVYAMAYDNTFGSAVRIEIDGKSATEIESEIQSRLEEAGFDAQVSVSMNGDDGMKIEVQAESEDPDAVTDDQTRIVLTRDGEPLAGSLEENAVRMEKSVDETGEHLTVEVVDGDRTLTARVENPGSLSDAELAGAVHRQLAEQGLDVSVSAQDGRVMLIPLQAPDGSRTPEKTTWGRIKKELGDPD